MVIKHVKAAIAGIVQWGAPISIRIPGIALVFVSFAVPVYADSFAFTQVTLDWTGLSFSLTGSLTITEIDRPGIGFGSGSGAVADSLTASSVSNVMPFITSAIVASPASRDGHANAQASTNNGVMSMQSAVASLEYATSHRGFANASSGDLFWFYGSGVGSIVVSTPYTMSVSCGVDDPGNETALGLASVRLSMGPGVFGGGQAFDSLSCGQQGIGMKSGTLTVERFLDNPTWGPLISIDAFAQTQSIVTVPEPASLVMVGVGLALVFLKIRSRNT